MTKKKMVAKLEEIYEYTHPLVGNDTHSSPTGLVSFSNKKYLHCISAWFGAYNIVFL